ncbi:plasmid recombination protein [Profundibacterium mesophilum]|uniref:Pre type recombination enzyme n=1 Tax=Profundibacterium mesophilum KAUST100406-0324 TaxID=1037889 RepID=A0A921TBM0_9RHOB|nr:plasmid recombination protein [Profundibacterium mesophilum]KAF0674473.1 putative Pre type recombination enzyme [Profundibacterium mesophilum KAUST100406-0324]
MAHQSNQEFAVVCRFQGLFPADLGGYEKHRTRNGGDLGHVNPSRSLLNRRVIGEANWAARTTAMIEDMKAENFADEIETLTRRRRKKQIKERMAEGPRDPWRATRHGPMREVILTANRDWFDALPTVDAREARAQAFEDAARDWLLENFGEDVVHARADLDEQAFHIHAVIVPKVQVELNGTKRWMLQPSKHDLIKNYEAAQDSVGQHFAPLGLVRGERRAEAVRKARQNGDEPPAYRQHVRTADWRKAEDTRIVETRAELDQRAQAMTAEEVAIERKREAVTGRENAIGAREDAAVAKAQEADAVLAVGQGLAAGAFDIEDNHGAPVLVETPDAKPGLLSNLRARMAPSSSGRARALHVFSRALARLREKARDEAKTAVARDTAEIQSADETIVEIASRLPDAERRSIGKIRVSLTARIMALTGRGQGNEDRPKGGDDERS